MNTIDRIKFECEKRDWTTRQLAAEANVPEQMLYGWLSRNSRSLDVDRLANIAKALGVTIDYLVTGKTGATAK